VCWRTIALRARRVACTTQPVSSSLLCRMRRSVLRSLRRAAASATSTIRTSLHLGPPSRCIVRSGTLRPRSSSVSGTPGRRYHPPYRCILCGKGYYRMPKRNAVLVCELSVDQRSLFQLREREAGGPLRPLEHSRPPAGACLSLHRLQLCAKLVRPFVLPKGIRWTPMSAGARTSINEPIIQTTDVGWVWHTADGERHELIAPFGTVHVTKDNLIRGIN
jgi:hypothetical protein